MSIDEQSLGTRPPEQLTQHNAPCELGLLCGAREERCEVWERAVVVCEDGHARVLFDLLSRRAMAGRCLGFH